MSVFSKDEIRAYLSIYQDSMAIFTTPFFPLNVESQLLSNFDTKTLSIFKSIVYHEALRGIDQLRMGAHIALLDQDIRWRLEDRKHEFLEFSSGFFDSLSSDTLFDAYFLYCEIVCHEVAKQYSSGNMHAVEDFKATIWLNKLMSFFESKGMKFSIDPRHL